MAFCNHCGKEVFEDAAVCVNCGRELHAAKAVNVNTLPKEEFKEQYVKHYKKNQSSHIVSLIVSFLLPIVGLILYLVWKDDKPFIAYSCGQGALGSVFLGIYFSIMFPLIF